MTDQELMVKFVDSLSKHLGYGRIISQADLDQGDTCQRIGTMFTLMQMVHLSIHPDMHPSVQDSMDSIKAEYGIYRRSPDPQSFGWDPTNLSRDQLSILKLAMIAIGDTSRLRSVAIRQALRFGFHQNIHRGGDSGNAWKIPDIMSPGEWSAYYRGFMGRLSVVPNFLIDMLLFGDLMLRKDDNWDVDNMLAINLLLANYKHPTIWSKLAMKMYLKTNFMDRLWNYHKDSDDNNGCEPLYWLFRIAFKDMYGYEPKDAP